MTKFNVIHGGLALSTPQALERKSGGGDNGGMDDLIRRVTALENDMQEVKTTLGRMEKMLERIELAAQKSTVELAELRGKVSQMPTSMHLLGFVIAILVASGLLKHLLP